MSRNKSILVCCPYYRPAYKAGGVVRTVSNLVDALSDEYSFYIISSNRDIDGKEICFPCDRDGWYRGDRKSQILYSSGFGDLIKAMRYAMKDCDLICVYLNSFFSIKYTLLPIMISLHSKRRFKIILAPRGELAESALNHKKFKKIAYRLFFDFFLKMLKIDFQASTEVERMQIKRQIRGGRHKVKVARDLPTIFHKTLLIERTTMSPLKLVFISRIHPIKNVLFLIRLLRGLEGRVQLDIYGNIEDQSYWNSCLEEIQLLPANVEVNYLGAVEPCYVSEVLTKYHFFVLPTKGENFGHAIIEALQLAVPVLISDATPWSDLEEYNAGFVLSLDNGSVWVSRLQGLIDMDADAYVGMRKNASEYYSIKFRQSDLLNESKALFQ